MEDVVVEPSSKTKKTAQRKLNSDKSRSSRSYKPKPVKAKLYSKPVNPSNSDGEPKAKLRTSKDVFNRLKWDSEAMDIDLTEMYIGYKDRFLGMCEVKFTDFNPCVEEGDIPFHRIYYFRGGGPPICPIIGKDGEIAVREDNWPPGAIIYWDRETRLDLIFNSGETFANGNKALRKPRGQGQVTPPIGYQAVPVYRYNTEEQEWTICEQVADCVDSDKLKLITLNILYEFYEEDFCVPYRRWPYLIDFLEESDADIIALQEVTSKFLAILESVPWVQQKYFLSDISRVGSTIKPYGQLFLTKFQPSHLFHSEQFSRRFIIGTFPFPDFVLSVANIHLISNFKGESSKLRQRQLHTVVSALGQLNPNNSEKAEVLIVGDTNFGNYERFDSSNIKLKLEDVSELLGSNNNSMDSGWTYNIYKNPMAKYLARGATEERFDRIFRNLNSTLLEPVRILVTGQEPIDLEVPARAQIPEYFCKFLSTPPEHQLCMSDHFALECDFIVRPAAKNQGTEDASKINVKTEHNGDNLTQPPASQQNAGSPHVHTSAVAIIPPTEVWSKIQQTRFKFDSSFGRWPPHINLLYGFIPEEKGKFSEAQAVFANILKQIDPIKIRLSKLETFKSGKKGVTVYLTASDTQEVQAIKNLQLQLEAAYPECKEQSSKSTSGFTPHLTIAKLKIGTGYEKENVAELIDEWQETFLEEPIEFTIDNIYIISRTLNDPFRIRKTIPIGSNISRKTLFLQQFLLKNKLVPSQDRKQEEKRVLTEIQRLCAQVLPIPETSVHLVGSSRMDFHDNTSDIDILVCGPPNKGHEWFFETLKEHYVSTDNTLRLVSIVLDTLVPIARFETQSGLEIDVVYCPCGAGNWNTISDEYLSNQSEAFVRSIDGIKESDTLLSLIPNRWWPTYSTCVRALKYWAKRRNIYAQVMGYFSSNTIALLLGKLILDTGMNPEYTTAEDLIEEFFEFYSSWKWPNPVRFNTEVPSPASFESKVPELMPICAPSFPYLNRARNVTKSTRTIIQREISRGNQLMRQIQPFETKWTTLCERDDFFRKYLTYIQVQIYCSDGEDAVVCEGILRSRLVKFVVELSKHFHILFQPYAQIISTVDNTAIALIGCDLKSVSQKDLEEVSLSFKLKLEKWISAYTRGRVRIEIDQLSSEAAALESLRLVDTEEDFDVCGGVGTDSVADTTIPSPEKQTLKELLPISASSSTGTSGYKFGLCSLALLTLALGGVLARRYWK